MIKKDIRFQDKNYLAPKIGIGMLGCGIIGKLHSMGFTQMPYIFWPSPAIPELIKICDSNEKLVKESMAQLGYLDYCTKWEDLINDDRVNIFINGAPNYLHAIPCI